MKSVYSQVKVYMVGERMQTCRTTFVIYREALLQADENVADANDTAICSAWEDGDLFGEFGYDAEDYIKMGKPGLDDLSDEVKVEKKEEKTEVVPSDDSIKKNGDEVHEIQSDEKPMTADE